MRLWPLLGAALLCLPALAAVDDVPDAPQAQAAKPAPGSRESLPHINQSEADQSDD